MRLKRSTARVVCVLLAAAVVFALFPTGMYYLAGGRSADWLFIGLLGALVCLAAAVWLRLRKLRCPRCGGSSAPPQWQTGRQYRCPCCGAPFRYDDEPEDPEEDEL